MSSNTMISLRPENVIRHLPWQLGSKTALGFLLILAVFSLVGWLYLTNASTVTATSYRIDELRLELDQIKNQNAALILEIAELEALSRVKARARALDFGPTRQLEYLPVANYPAPSNRLGLTKSAEGRLEISVDAYIDDLERPSWWVKQLDRFAAWLDGVEQANSMRSRRED